MTFKQEPFHLLNKVVLGRAIFQPPFKISSALENEARFVHVIKGRSRLYSPKNQVDLKEGDSLVMRCENFVNNWIENEDGEKNEVIIVHFYPEVLQFVYDNKIPTLFQSEETESNAIEKLELNGMIKNYIHSMRFYLENPSMINQNLLKIKVQELIHILLNSKESARMKTILGSLFKAKEYEFKEIIHSHLYEDLSIQDLAFFTGLSLSSFKRKFKAVFGTSPGQYIKSKRLERAKELLERTSLRVSEIAYDCGFNDIGYFSKSFSSSYQLTPSNYRKRYLDQISQ